MGAEKGRVTHLLHAWRAGDAAALDHLISIVHGDLRRIARRHLVRERTGHILQTDALVNEAYVRLVDTQAVRWHDRAHFLAVASRVMRRILVEAARARRRQKRGGGEGAIPIDGAIALGPNIPDLLPLNDALEALADVSPRKSQVVELRFFGGLTIDETAAVLNVSGDTIRRDWRLAKAWLYRELQRS
jgi:RNA polymerase sigma factor (TIGR02999 family)